MFIDSFNLNLLRIFECVYRNQNMTKASYELHMTQSGVSQNIKNLEEVLGFTLFDRIKKKPIPTEKAHLMYEMCRSNLYNIEATLGKLMGVEQEFSGTISIGLPIEFGNNIILPLLSEFSKKNTSVTYRIVYGHAAEMNQLILKGELDFSVVDTFGFDKEIKTEIISSEELVLCASKNYFSKKKSSSKIDKNFFETLEYITYIEGAPILKNWFKHHYGFSNLSINSKATLMNVQGVAQLIVQDLGVGILPVHMVERLKKRGEDIHIFRAKSGPLYNSLSIAYLESKTMSSGTRECIKYLSNSLK
ncbi:hypothetical protein A9Q84_12580 [Halobacteriovorax marinus]|uniref:HTH lysR-type domain-containing protein n=1 Tax=Halobacteriovorax marinus TaxID=97084 RepID=A0A1Y5F8A9_9BACT|nr:hypothetical protein A9Q84_12580 [Halobacteriovorax marinus]